MPFQSEKQRRYLWANEPEIARDWSKKYGNRVKKYDGGDITNFDPMPTNIRAVYPAAADYNMNLGLQNYDTSGGYLSNARHAAASSLMRDQLGGGIGGKIGANAMGLLNELAGLGKGVYGEAKELFGGPKHSFMNTLGQTGEDLVANLYGSLYGKPVTDEMEYNISPAENVYKDMMSQLGSSKSDGLKGILEQMMEAQAQANLKYDPNSLTQAKLAEALTKRTAKGSWPGPYNQRGDYLVGTEADAANKMATLSMSDAINSPDIQIAQKLANLDKFTRSPHKGFAQSGADLDKWGNRRMALEKEDFYEAPSGLASLMKDFKTKTGEKWDFAQQLPGMAISALSGIPGLGFLLSSIKPDPRDKYLGDPYSMQNYRGRNYGYGNTLRHGNLKGQDQFGINTRSLFGDYQGHYGKFMNNYLAGNIKKNKFNKAKYDFAQEVTGTKKTSPNITGTPLITSTSIHQGPDTPQGGNWGAAPGTPGGWDPGARKDGGRIGYKTGGIASLWPR